MNSLNDLKDAVAREMEDIDAGGYGLARDRRNNDNKRDRDDDGGDGEPKLSRKQKQRVREQQQQAVEMSRKLASICRRRSGARCFPASATPSWRPGVNG